MIQSRTNDPFVHGESFNRGSIHVRYAIMSANGEITYDGGDYTSRQNLLLGVTGAGLVLSTTAVALRLIARRYLHVNLWWDDYLAILAMVCASGGWKSIRLRKHAHADVGAIRSFNMPP